MTYRFIISVTVFIILVLTYSIIINAQPAEVPGDIITDPYRIPGPPSASVCDIPRPQMIMLTPPDINNIAFPCLNWKKHVYWVDGYGKKEPYNTWDITRKKRLKELFELLWKGEDLKINCTDPEWSTTYIHKEWALEVYLAHVAHALFLEYNMLVPTRLHSLPAAELNEILSPKAYYQPLSNKDNAVNLVPALAVGRSYRLPLRQSFGYAHLCDPTTGYKFMKYHNLLGVTERDTLIRLTAFTRDEVAHSFGGLQPKSVSLLRDRLDRKLSADGTQRSYWAGGCQGAGNLIADLAHSVNLPLLRAGSFDDIGNYRLDNPGSTHHALIWRWERGDPLVLQHVDDIYALGSYSSVFPVIKDVSGWRMATASEKDKMFFEKHWVSPQVLQQYGYQYKLEPLKKRPIDFVCEDPAKCDTEYVEYVIGYWDEDPTEKIKRNNANVEWYRYLLEMSSRVMSDGKKCFDPLVQPTSFVEWPGKDVKKHTGFHPECKEQASIKHFQVFNDFKPWLYSKSQTFQRDKGIQLGEYKMLNFYCANYLEPQNILIMVMKDYLDEFKNTNPVTTYTVGQLIDWSKTIVTAYGGCQNIRIQYLIHNEYKVRLTP